MKQISKNSLDNHKVTLLRSCLKSCTHAHTKHNIRPRYTKIKERADHGSIYLLIHRFTFLVEVEVSSCSHWGLDGLGTFHVKLLEHVGDVLGLTQEGSFLELLDLKTEEVLELTHHRHLEPLSHNPTKIFTKSLVSTTKYYVIDIYLAHKQINIEFTSEKSRIG